VDLGGDFSGKPAVTARFPATLDLMGTAIAGGAIWSKTSNNGSWPAPFSPLGGRASPGTGPALTTLGGDVLNLEITDDRGLLWHWHMDSNTGWSAPFQPVGGQPQGSPAIVQTQEGTGHTLIVMLDQNEPGIWHRTWK
jgi:hypothetical protein